MGVGFVAGGLLQGGFLPARPPPPGAPLVLPPTAQPGTVTLLADGFRWIPCVSAWLPAVPVH